MAALRPDELLPKLQYHLLEAGSDALRVLEARLAEVEARRLETLANQRAKEREHAKLEDRAAGAREARERALALAATLEEAARVRLAPQLAAWQAEALGDKALTVENVDAAQRTVRGFIQGRIDNVGKAIGRLDEAILTAMADFKHHYPAETAEMDARVEAASEYRALLARLVGEDLPRHEAAFKAMLNERTIQGVAMFHNWLEKAYHEIEEKIATINRSLRAIPYNEGTYIQLVDERSQDVEVREFRRDLRECLGGTLAGDEDELYAEHKFDQVKRLIDRFNGREGLAEHDAKWMAKVVDVRNWFRFGASERWAEDDVEREYYEDSAGKSGGQKEKLAYTILASALAFQYGLERGGSRAFRFVRGPAGLRELGQQRVPVRAVIPTQEDALRLAGKVQAFRRFEALVAETRRRLPALLPYVAHRPLAALELADAWPGLLAVCEHLAAHPRPGGYLRALDVPGVDTKFLERHAAVLWELLPLVLPPAAVDVAVARREAHAFERRFGFAHDLAVPLAAFAAWGEPGVATVVVTENKVNGLAFPPLPGAIVIFGLGYGVQALREVPWLADRRLVYWGDLDTHGFAILAQLRGLWPQTASFLMDEATLLAHRAAWGQEPEAQRCLRELPELTAAERAAYEGLRTDAWGPRVRLEQERIAFGAVEAAVRHLSEPRA